MNKCDLIIKSISSKQQAEMRTIVMKHMDGIKKKYMGEIFEIIAKRDMVGAVKVMRLIVKEKEFKKKFILILDDMSQLYKKNKVKMDKIIACFLSNCNSETINFLHEIFGLVYDLFNTLNDATVNKKMDIIRGYLIENIKNAGELLLIKNPKVNVTKTNVVKANVKKPNVAKVSVKKSTQRKK